MLSPRNSWFPVTFLLLSIGFACASFAEEQKPTPFRSATSEVRISFVATDTSNRPLANLTPSDFAIVDGEAVVRDFRSFTRSDETALDLILLVDASESVGRQFESVIDGVSQMDAGKHAGDRVSVLSFCGMRSSVLCASCDRGQAAEKLRSIRADGATPLYDALVFASEFVASHHQPYRQAVVILFSDGNDTISKVAGREALEAVVNSGALLYTVDLDARVAVSPGGIVLRRMAEATGGRSFRERDGASDVLQAIMADARASYTVTYGLPNHAAGFHSLRILPTRNLNLRFHCRNGYFYGENHP